MRAGSSYLATMSGRASISFLLQTGTLCYSQRESSEMDTGTMTKGFPEVKTYYRLLDRRSMAVREQMKDLLEAEVRFKKDLERNRRPARLIRF